MALKRMLQVIVIIAILVSSFVLPNNTLAWFACSSYVTVQWGDTLSGIAALCGTTAEAIRAANPGLGWWVYAGQVLYIPTGYSYTPTYSPTYNNTYVVQHGDTLGKIAAKVGVSIADILAINPQIWNPNLIFSGQVINLPAATYVATTVYVSDPVYISVSDPTYYPPAPTYSSGNSLKISYKNGLLVRCDPGGEIIGYATYDEYKKWYYSSIFRDDKGKIWAQVTLDPPQSGYTIGWILVKDQFGTYFTSPNID